MENLEKMMEETGVLENSKQKETYNKRYYFKKKFKNKDFRKFVLSGRNFSFLDSILIKEEDPINIKLLQKFQSFFKFSKTPFAQKDIDRYNKDVVQVEEKEGWFLFEFIYYYNINGHIVRLKKEIPQEIMNDKEKVLEFFKENFIPFHTVPKKIQSIKNFRVRRRKYWDIMNLYNKTYPIRHRNKLREHLKNFEEFDENFSKNTDLYLDKKWKY